jgi:hypothetical protein
MPAHGHVQVLQTVLGFWQFFVADIAAGVRTGLADLSAPGARRLAFYGLSGGFLDRLRLLMLARMDAEQQARTCLAHPACCAEAATLLCPWIDIMQSNTACGAGDEKRVRATHACMGR